MHITQKIAESLRGMHITHRLQVRSQLSKTVSSARAIIWFVVKAGRNEGVYVMNVIWMNGRMSKGRLSYCSNGFGCSRHK